MKIEYIKCDFCGNEIKNDGIGSFKTKMKISEKITDKYVNLDVCNSCMKAIKNYILVNKFNDKNN